MIVSKPDSSAANNQKSIITGCIVDKVVLGSVASRWTKEGLFQDRWSNLVVGWCVRYYSKYGKAPGKHVTNLFDSWASSRQRDDDVVKIIDKFLSSLSDNYKREKKSLSAEYVIDIAGELFNAVEMRRTMERVEGMIANGEVSRASELWQKTQRIEMGVGATIDVFHDKESFKRVFVNNKRPPLIAYPGAAGHFFGKQLNRKKMVCFLAPMKRGKSYFLLDMAWLAAEQGRRVLFYTIGDMTEQDVFERLIPRAIGRPIESSYSTFPGWFDDAGKPKREVNKVRIPESFTYGTHEILDWKEKSYKKTMPFRKAWKLTQDKIVSKSWEKEVRIKLSVHSASSLSVSRIAEETAMHARHGWVPDVVVIDYADVLSHPNHKESRDGVNASWKQMRKLSQDYNSLVLTATQGTRDSIKAETLEMHHFSEDIRKAATVTAVIGINQTEAEKESQVYRLNFPAVRSQKNSVDRFLYVAGCLDIMSPVMISTF